MSYRLPDGTTTTSATKYSKTWRKLAKPIEKMMGWDLYAFDPSLTFSKPNGNLSALPVDLVIKINELLERK